MTPIKILFICHGNICRSPMAEFRFKDLLARAGCQGRYLVRSAATTSEEIWNGKGNPIYPPARKKLLEKGIGIQENELGVSEKRAQQFRPSDYQEYDYIIGMDAENMNDLRRMTGGDPLEKLSCLMDFTDNPHDVADPWYTRNFDATWEDIDTGCKALFAKLEEAA